MTQLAGEPARTLALAACLEALGADLHRTGPPPPGHATGVDARVADTHGAAAREASGAIARLADRLLDDADRLYLVTARHRHADDRAAAGLTAVRPLGSADATGQAGPVPGWESVGGWPAGPVPGPELARGRAERGAP